MERLIAYHCTPAMAGIKPSSIVSCHKTMFGDAHKQIDKLNSELNGRDIYLEVLFECDKRILLMVYRKSVLERTLTENKVVNFLKGFGYGEGLKTTDKLDILKSRLACDSFPHEIGVFLGYPLHDVFGFIENKGRGGILTGEWKVYENAEEAQKLFNRFSACKRAVLKRIINGKRLSDIFKAA